MWTKSWFTYIYFEPEDCCMNLVKKRSKNACQQDWTLKTMC